MKNREASNVLHCNLQMYPLATLSWIYLKLEDILSYMAKFYGKASLYLKKNTLIEKYAFIVWCVFLIATIYWIFIENWNKLNLWSWIGWLVIVVMFGPIIWIIVGQIKRRYTEFVYFRNGQKGESSVWYELGKLSNNFIIFQDIKVGERGNIDFVVLGPTGLFTLEVKSHKGNINFDGNNLLVNNKCFEKDVLSQTMAEALVLHKYLYEKINQELFINPVLVFSSFSARVHFGLGRIRNIFIIQRKYLNKLIYSQPEVYSQELILKIENELKNLVAR